MKKILVIINKNWETEPVLNALTNPKLRPAALPFPEVINTPCDGDNRMSQPRAVFSLPREGEEPLQVVVRCIEDLMATGVNTSSSLEKYKVLPQAIAADAADLIISVSTANYPDPAVNRCPRRQLLYPRRKPRQPCRSGTQPYRRPRRHLHRFQRSPCRVQSGRNRQRPPALLPRRRMQTCPAAQLPRTAPRV